MNAAAVVARGETVTLVPAGAVDSGCKLVSMPIFPAVAELGAVGDPEANSSVVGRVDADVAWASGMERGRDTEDDVEGRDRAALEARRRRGEVVEPEAEARAKTADAIVDDA